MKIDISSYLVDSNSVLRKTISGRVNMTLVECFNGLETWYEIKSNYDDNTYSVRIIDTVDLETAKKAFLKELK